MILVAVTNLGGTAVAVSGVASRAPVEFSISGSNFGVVNPGAQCSFFVTFTPSAVGARSTTITIVSSGIGSPQTITVTGIGTGAATPPPATIEVIE